MAGRSAAIGATRAIGLALALLTPGGVQADEADDLARGDAAWEDRAVGEQDGRPQLGPIQQAVGFFEATLRERPDQLEARWKLLRALHFAGEFAVEEEGRKREFFDRARAVSEQGLDLAARELGGGTRLEELDPASLRSRVEQAGVRPRDVARVYFWGALNWGSWSRMHGRLASVRAGVAGRLDAYSRVTLALEPDYSDGGAYRLQGRLHAKLPRVPFISGWADREKAIPMIERAYAMDPSHPGTRLLLAITLLDLAPERRAEAIGLLRQVETLTPRPSMRVEDLAVRRAAHERLLEEGAQYLQGRVEP